MISKMRCRTALKMFKHMVTLQAARSSETATGLAGVDRVTLAMMSNGRAERSLYATADVAECAAVGPRLLGLLM
jgi:hypothetical protein